MTADKRQRLVAIATFTYLIIAFAWWTLLLREKVREAYDARVDALTTELAISGDLEYSGALENNPRYLALQREYRRENLMIVGEAFMIGLSIILVVFLALRNFRRFLKAASQQRNFLLSITHELKSPLAGIRLVLETLKTRQQLPDAARQKLTGNALTETDRLTSLVNDLLLGAKLDSRYQLNPEPLELAPLLEDCIDKITLKYPGAKFHFDVEPGLPPVPGDRSGLTSVFTNLIENAAKYSQPEPRIEISLRRGGTDEVSITVADNGNGIPDRMKRRVFDRFYRIGNEDTRQTKGTGLGLYIVKKLVDLHGGLIELEDNQPKGSRFVVSLPV